VGGVGEGGPGVRGSSDKDRGGIFSSIAAPQSAALAVSREGDAADAFAGEPDGHPLGFLKENRRCCRRPARPAT
jgi:hypothetical protein